MKLELEQLNRFNSLNVERLSLSFSVILSLSLSFYLSLGAFV